MQQPMHIIWATFFCNADVDIKMLVPSTVTWTELATIITGFQHSGLNFFPETSPRIHWQKLKFPWENLVPVYGTQQTWWYPEKVYKLNYSFVFEYMCRYKFYQNANKWFNFYMLSTEICNSQKKFSEILTLSCPGMGRAKVKVGQFNFRPGSIELWM